MHAYAKNKRKTIYTAFIIFAFIMLLNVFMIACNKNNGELPEITGVAASDVDVRYDGLEHFITVDNVLETDEISYSVYSTGPWVSNNLTYTEPGEYIVYYRIVRDGYKEYISSAKITIGRGILSGISAADKTYIYDGQSHGIEIIGAHETDTIVYSLDGKEFKSVLELVEVGEYVVYYRVSTAHSDYADSCIVTILPDISGRYLNSENGVIILNDVTAAVNGEIFSMSYDVAGTGKIGDEAFSVKDGTLTFCGAEYSIIGDNDKIYAITVDGTAVYVGGGETLALEIKFVTGGAEIYADGEAVMTVADRNYCESINVDVERSYTTSDITVSVDGDVQIELSNREEQTIEIPETQVIFDGNAHGIDFDYDGEIFFVEEEHEFSAVGRYEITVVLIKDGYLPKQMKAVLEIIPDLSGIYYCSDEVLSVNGKTAESNGQQVELEYKDGGWMIDGTAVNITSNGIIVGEKTFTRLGEDACLALIFFGEEVIVITGSDNLTITVKDGTVELSDERGTKISRALEAQEITVTVNGRELSYIPDDEGRTFIIGSDELKPNRVTKIVVAFK